MIFDSIPPTCRRIIERLQAAGYEAVLAGGCVRDTLLGRTPKDWDIATSARPSDIEALFEHTIGVGRQFGIMVVVEDGDSYEVATFRGDGRYEDGRRPVGVTFVSMQQDVLRRDFTINALLADPVSDTLFDFVGGQADLQAKIVRTVGDARRRFSEDKLRLLRAIRFSSNLDFELEPATFQAVCAAAEDIRVISAERIFAELDRMLQGGYSARAFRLLMQSGMMPFILPEVQALVGVEQPPQFHPEGDVWQHTLKILVCLDEFCRSEGRAQYDSSAFQAIAWAVLLHDIGKPGTMVVAEDRIHFNGHDSLGAKMVCGVLKRLKASNQLIEAVEYLVANHMNITAFPKMREATRIRRMSHPLFGALLEVFRMDCQASFGGLNLYEEIRSSYREFLKRPIPVRPPVNGRDLLEMGYKPGPLFKQILDAVTDASLETPFASKEEACRWIANAFKK